MNRTVYAVVRDRDTKIITWAHGEINADIQRNQIKRTTGVSCTVIEVDLSEIIGIDHYNRCEYSSVRVREW